MYKIYFNYSAEQIKDYEQILNIQIQRLFKMIICSTLSTEHVFFNTYHNTYATLNFH